MRCPSCGTENAPDSRFCGGCGARLEPPRVAPTFKIPEDAAYQQPVPTPPPGSLNSIGHLPTPAPGSLAMPPQPRLGSIPPTNPQAAIARPSSVPPTDRLPSRPPVAEPPRPASSPPGARVATPVPAAEPSMSMPAAPRKSGALIAVVLIADLGLAAAGGALLFKGLQKPKAAPAVQKTEAAPPPPPAAAAAADLTAPPPAPAPAISPPAKSAPEPVKTVPKEAAKKAPVTKTKPGAAPVDPYGGAPAPPDLTGDIDRMAAQSVGSFRNCLAQALQTQPIHGDVRIAFVIQPDGHVDHTRVVADSTESPQLTTCLAATIATWTFAPHSGPAASFERPFNYP